MSQEHTHPNDPSPETAPEFANVAQKLGSLLDKVREAAPLTQCLTNTVVTNFTANVLLAVGASPAMVDGVEEAPIFAQVADAMLINVGTVNAMTADAMRAAAQARRAAGKPWVLDPVAVGALPLRTELARELLPHTPDVVRGNASEIIGLVGGETAGRGVDAGDDVDAARDTARQLVERTGGAVAVSGPIDFIHSHSQTLRIANGSPIMTKVTGVGCALGALVAAFAAVSPEDPALAAAAATAALTVAADDAAYWASGPGSFAVELLDALARIDGETVAQNVRLS